MHCVKESPSDFISVRCVLINAKRREAAVARYLCCYTLFDERSVKLFRIFSVVEEVIMRVSINKAGTYLISADIYGFVSICFYAVCYPDNAVVLDKYIACVRLSPGTIIYQSALEQCLHLYTSLFLYGINKLFRITIFAVFTTYTLGIHFIYQLFFTAEK